MKEATHALSIGSRRRFGETWCPHIEGMSVEGHWSLSAWNLKVEAVNAEMPVVIYHKNRCHNIHVEMKGVFEVDVEPYKIVTGKRKYASKWGKRM